jgi:hypothetical protein
LHYLPLCPETPPMQSIGSEYLRMRSWKLGEGLNSNCSHEFALADRVNGFDSGWRSCTGLQETSVSCGRVMPDGKSVSCDDAAHAVPIFAEQRYVDWSKCDVLFCR